jgi:hypothetical protein
LGDRFVVEVDDELITISKLFVYPDFSKTVGQLGKNPRKKLTPSKENPRKNRRRKNGQGNGSIYYRTVTKNGKQYTEAYYHYVDNGKKRTKYKQNGSREMVRGISNVNRLNAVGKSISSIGITMRSGGRAIALSKSLAIFPSGC